MVRDGSQSIRRSIDVLDAVAAKGEGGIRLQEVVRATGLTAPTVHRILKVFLERRIVERKGGGRRYSIGEHIPILALARTSRSPLLQAAEPFLRRLAEELGDTAYLTIRTGSDALCIARHFGSYHTQVVTIQVGARRPICVSAAGVAMLAAMPEHYAKELISSNVPRFDEFKTNATRVAKIVADARTRGYVC